MQRVLIKASILFSAACLAAAAGGAEAVRPPAFAGDSPAEAYCARFRKHLGLARQDVGAIYAAAEGVADKFIQSKVIYAAPNQDSFLFELFGRASGLTALKRWRPENMPLGNTNDILLLALEPTTDYPDANSQWVNMARKSPAAVIAFAAPADLNNVPKDGNGGFLPSDFHALVDNHTAGNQFVFKVPGKQPRTVATAGMVNMLNGWMFVGELAAACTRRGRMPVFWLNFAVDGPGGYARAAKYSLSIPKGRPWGEQKPFHDDLSVPPVKAGVIASRYLDHLESYMDQIEGPLWRYMEKIVQRAISKIEQGHKVFVLIAGHAFPLEVPGPDRRDVFILLGPRWSGHMAPFDKEASRGDLLILLCMPAYARDDVKLAQDKGLDVIVMSTEPPDVAQAETDAFLWIRAPWPLEDGAVKVPGYDIPILPVTGIMNGVIYYALRSEIEYRQALKAMNAAGQKK